MKKAIDTTLQPLKDRLKAEGEKEEEEEEEEEDDNLQLDAFPPDEVDGDGEEDRVEGVREAGSIHFQYGDYNVTIDETVLDAVNLSEDSVDNRHIEDNHEISGFSFNVVTLPHLQHYFKKPFTYSGVDAGKLLLFDGVDFFFFAFV